MAASVLGKRSRKAVDAEDLCLSLSSRKRRTRNTTPQIHLDDETPSKTSTHQAVACSTSPHGPQHDLKSIHQQNRPCIASTKRTIPDGQAQYGDENRAPLNVQTPSASRFRDALSEEGFTTPKHRVKFASKLLTPRTPRTPRTALSSTSRTRSIYAEARQLFAPSNSPRKLVGRDAERRQLTTFISNAVESRYGGCTYISGPPGTGKSALAHEIVETFEHTQHLRIATINCVSAKSPKEVQDKLVEEFCSGVVPTRKTGKALLSELFLGRNQSTATSYLVLLDEIDTLLDGDCEVLYSLFEWALQKSSSLILIGIANALDLTDRFLPQLKARSFKPILLPFLPYTASQISAIITERLRSTLPAGTDAAQNYVPFVHPAAIQLSSKKIASQTGDLRKAFNLIRRAIDQIEQETLAKEFVSATASPTKQPLTEISNVAPVLPPTPPTSSPLKPSPHDRGLTTATTMTVENAPRATIAHIARLASNIFNNGTLARLSGLNLQQKAVLCALIAAEKKGASCDPFQTPSKSAKQASTIKDLFMKYAFLCRQDDGVLQPLKGTEFRDVVASLETLGLVNESARRGSISLTPSKTPSRIGRDPDERQIASAVSEKEMVESLTGPGADLLRKLLDG